MKKYKNYLIIGIYGLIITFFLVGFNHIYGSTTDWINQHSVIPDYFRKIFYETKSFLPNFAFNLGAGQNIFNYAYYGLLSPIILISYLLPFISMPSYIMIASIIIYIGSGILMYKFLINNKITQKSSLFLSLSFLSLSSLTFHFHHHIMFVWYMPFLILSLIGVDKYLEKNKSLLLIISTFLIIMTNYYYSIVSLVVIIIYGIYKLLQSYDIFTFKLFIKDVLKAAIRIVIPILMAGLILLPTFYVILNSNRMHVNTITLKQLFFPNLNEILYSAFTPGISVVFIIALGGILLLKIKNKENIFLSIILLLITLIPIFMYVFNGFLYVRGKILIPFIPLYFLALTIFLKNLKNINFKYLIILILSIFVISMINSSKQIIIITLIDLIITFLFLYLYRKKDNKYLILIPLIVILGCCSFIINTSEKYISIKKYQEINNYNLNNLLNKIKDDSYYRIDNYTNAHAFINKYFNKNYYSTSIYSSNYNNDYHNFYFNNSFNNLKYRNILITGGADNILFNNLMGIKYIISEENLNHNYELISENNNQKLYFNKNALPILYVTDKVGSLKTYNKLKQPYNIEYMLNNPVVNSNEDIPSKTNIKEIELDNKETYNFKLNNNKNITYKLDDLYKEDKLLLIMFDMNYNETCDNGDTSITINGIKNKLTCKEWIYHNQNKTFKYVISLKDNKNLNINISKGKYYISNIKTYILDNNFNKYQALNNIKIDKKKSEITADIKVNSNSYVISSIPYDEGFSIYVNNKKVKLEKVNTAFMGFKINKGNNKIKIVYNSPWLNYGKIISIIGLILLSGLIIYERKHI